MRQRGHTLYELMISLAVIGVLAGLCATIAASAREDDRVARAYADDLRHVRDASDMLARQLRSADDVSVADGNLVIDGETWSIRDDALCHGPDVAVRGVSRLDIEDRGEGLWRIAVAPVPRRVGAVAPSVFVTARQRVEVNR